MQEAAIRILKSQISISNSIRDPKSRLVAAVTHDPEGGITLFLVVERAQPQ
jgi:hypothetical protein